MDTKKPASKTEATPKKRTLSRAPKHIGLVQNDGYLEPFEDAIKGPMSRSYSI